MGYNKIYSGGSSFSCAGGLNWGEVQNLYSTLHDIKINNHIDYAYPNLISKKNDVSIVNDSIPGGSANRMIRKTFDYIHNHQSESKTTLFLLEIPPMWRDEFYSNDFDKMFNITWGVLKNSDDNTDVANGYDKSESLLIKNDLRDYFSKFINVDFEIKKTMNNILGLLSYLKLNNIQYVLLNGFEFYTFLLKNNLKLDYNFYWIDGSIEPINISFINKNLTITQELNDIYTDNHLGYFGNEYVANNLNEFIKNTIK
jgi:hypothetical protein